MGGYLSSFLFDVLVSLYFSFAEVRAERRGEIGLKGSEAASSSVTVRTLLLGTGWELH